MSDGILVIEQPVGQLVISVAQGGNLVVGSTEESAILIASAEQGPPGPGAMTDASFSWQRQLGDGEKLPGVSVRFAMVFTDADSGGFLHDPCGVGGVFNICNRVDDNVIGTATFAAGSTVPTVSFTGGRFAAVRGDFVYLIAPNPADPLMRDGAITLAGQ